MKVKFKEVMENIYEVREDGKDTKGVEFELIGFITFCFKNPLDNSLFIKEDFSGVIDLESLKEIVKFMDNQKIKGEKE